MGDYGTNRDGTEVRWHHDLRDGHHPGPHTESSPPPHAPPRQDGPHHEPHHPPAHQPHPQPVHDAPHQPPAHDGNAGHHSDKHGYWDHKPDDHGDKHSHTDHTPGDHDNKHGYQDHKSGDHSHPPAPRHAQPDARPYQANLDALDAAYAADSDVASLSGAFAGDVSLGLLDAAYAGDADAAGFEGPVSGAPDGWAGSGDPDPTTDADGGPWLT
ncbi:hypothetical protein ACWGR4_43695 [Embleya sp. NPDC055664]